ncbi:diacylglycerol/polyprenol kinase family protein [Prochlorothrix hollandica]|uniref:Phosphatidate cytidylyltransferase n=1 Tax=Prochlorothrix hollandica PCC 9006 = CALU 1027 TaxID=317619 RepID=A0A0M2PY27_PROHO|nr:diacylglycerol/polyprenol kinase family protein [Prochlorothrix hollandica]KKJ01321.1 phosphatidate cytidylyltransferase [Prochlorothrix hollandica PCC 9006 = CALU 1027]
MPWQLADPLTLGINVGWVALWLALVGFSAWWLHRQPNSEPEFVRKTVHIGTGNVILLAWWLQIPAGFAIAASLLFSAISLLSYYLPLLPGINSVGRSSFGTFFYAASIGLLVAWFWPLDLPQFAVLGILVMTWGDGLAALVGRRWGRHPYQLWGEKKSWEGSLTMALVSWLVGGLVLGTLGLGWAVTWGVALGVAIAATALEACSKLGIDNLTVPLGSAALGFWLWSWLPWAGG